MNMIEANWVGFLRCFYFLAVTASGLKRTRESSSCTAQCAQSIYFLRWTSTYKSDIAYYRKKKLWYTWYKHINVQWCNTVLSNLSLSAFIGFNYYHFGDIIYFVWSIRLYFLESMIWIHHKFWNKFVCMCACIYRLWLRIRKGN